jgi:hypothetical protein
MPARYCTETLLILRQYLADGLESFGRLRIINEDRIQAHNGFGFHSHQQGLEIFTLRDQRRAQTVSDLIRYAQTV